MKAAIYESFGGAVEVQNVVNPEHKADSVIVKVMATGICRSDWHGWMGHDSDIELPHVPGHELAGIIEEVGNEVKNWKKGDRVTVPFVGGCGKCEQCYSGNHQVCDNQFQPGFTAWGSFAEYVRINYADTNLVKLPEEISFEVAASLGCRFITSFRGIVQQGKVKGGDWVAVHGCGGVGLSAIMIANALGANVIAIDIDNSKLELAKKIGARVGLNAKNSHNIVEEIKEISKGGVHVSMDALGNKTTAYNSVANLRKRGKHIQVGLLAGDDYEPKLPLHLLVANELEIIGSHGMQAFNYHPMLEMIKNKKLRPEMLIGSKVTLEEACKILPNMNSFEGVGVKVITTF